jgi:HAD superfamily hydrolase (TIGR01509 family)
LERRYSAEELRRATLGHNFRDTAKRLLTETGMALPAAELDCWVACEQEAVTAALTTGLQPDPAVAEALSRLEGCFRLAVVTSSACSRLSASLLATGLDRFFSAERRFSAEDSLEVPTSKPDPAVYLFAARQLGVGPTSSTAVEDSPPGVTSAVAAGMRVIGNVAFARADERAQMRERLLNLGAIEVVSSWDELAELLAA